MKMALLNSLKKLFLYLNIESRDCNLLKKISFRFRFTKKDFIFCFQYLYGIPIKSVESFCEHFKWLKDPDARENLIN